MAATAAVLAERLVTRIIMVRRPRRPLMVVMARREKPPSIMAIGTVPEKMALPKARRSTATGLGPGTLIMAPLRKEPRIMVEKMVEKRPARR